MRRLQARVWPPGLAHRLARLGHIALPALVFTQPGADECDVSKEPNPRMVR
jgi:hypothetical protein